MKTHNLALWWGFAAAAVRLNRSKSPDLSKLDKAAKRCGKLDLPGGYEPDVNPFFRLFRLVRPPRHVPMVRDAIWRQLVVDAGFALDAELKRLTGEPSPAPEGREGETYVRVIPPRADIDG